MKKNGFSELYEKEYLQEWSNGFLKRCAKVKKLTIFQRIKRWIIQILPYECYQYQHPEYDLYIDELSFSGSPIIFVVNNALTKITF